jgi:hypothetical protein
MSITAEQPATNLFLALDQIGVTGLSDEDCCRLLAWFGVFGCQTEESVNNWKLNKDIQIAQHRLNMFGGQTPNLDLLLVVNSFRAELTDGNKPDWCIEIEKKYNIQSKDGEENC